MHTATRVNMTKAPQCRVLFASARTYRSPGKAPNAWKHKAFLVLSKHKEFKWVVLRHHPSFTLFLFFLGVKPTARSAGATVPKG